MTRMWVNGVRVEYTAIGLENASRKASSDRQTIRLYRSCESLEATSASSWSDFEAYPAVCRSPYDCAEVLRCDRLEARWSAIFTAIEQVRAIRWRVRA